MPGKSVLISMLMLVCSSMSLARITGSEKIMPDDAIQYIARAIRNNPVVCPAEGGHGSKTAHGFLKAMLLDKNVQDAVDVIMVEFVTARYQARLDDYMNRKDIPLNELNKLWRDTTVSSMP